MQAKAAKDAAAAKKKAAEESAAAWRRQDDAIMSSVKSVGMFALSMAGLSSVSTVLNTIVDRFNDIRIAGIKAAQDILDEAGELRVLGAMKGEMGQPSQQLVDQLRFRTETLQSAGDARVMSAEAMSSAYGSISRARQPGRIR